MLIHTLFSNFKTCIKSTLLQKKNKLMQILPRLINFFRLGIKGIVDESQLHKIMMFNALSLVGALLCLIFGIISIINQDYLLSGILGAMVLIALGILVYLAKSKNIGVSGWLLTFVMTAFLLYLIVIGEEEHGGILWVLIFPIASIFVLGNRYGSYASAGFIALLLITTLVICPYLLDIHYSAFFIIRVGGVYVTMWFLMIMFDYLRLLHYEKLEENMLNAINNSNTKDEFISKLSHPIRTPLNNIMVISDLMNDTRMDENQKDLMETIVASTNNLVGVVNNIVRVSNIEISEKKDYNIKFNLFSTLNNTFRLFQKNENLEINMNFPGQIRQTLIGDPIKVKQIFMNLIDNIAKFHSQRKAFIDVRVWISRENEEIFAAGIELKTPLIPIRFISDSSVKPVSGQATGMDTLENDVLDFTIARKLIEHSKGKMEVTNTTQFSLFTFDL